ncbi:MAG: C10 family peptidase [bacterium]|nr:C10 family peptidase [bacterium]
MSAEPVSPELALQAASTWLSRFERPRVLEAVRMAPVVLDTITLDDELPGLHIVSDGVGFALVAGDMQAEPILGWAAAGEFLTGQAMHPGLAELLHGWGTEILLARQADPDKAARSNIYRQKWDALLDSNGRAATPTVDEIQPLLAARWNQGNGWNAHCPSDPAGPGGHAYVGCVAVALAQVLFHHQHPWRGQRVQSYEHDRYGQITMYMAEETPAWKDMAAAGITDAVARLLYMAGVGVRMNYGPSSSSAQSSMVVSALRLFLRYADTARMVWRSSTPPETWEALIPEELQAGRPIVHRGQGPTGGHAFNLDGWRSDGYKHLNFGWGGSYNGWYTLDSITPFGIRDYTSVQGMVVGIQPRVEELIAPRDGDHNVPPHAVLLRWKPRQDMARIELDIAYNAQFSPVARRAILQGHYTQHTISGLAPSTRTFWRITWVDKTGRRYPVEPCSFVTGLSPLTHPGSGRPAMTSGRP